MRCGRSGGDFWSILSLKPRLNHPPERRGASVAIMMAQIYIKKKSQCGAAVSADAS